MILGWRYANSIGRYVKVDARFPHPALHHGRTALRQWAEIQGRMRETGTQGPVRWLMRKDEWDAVLSAVGEIGEHVDIRIWPVAREMQPRPWTDLDTVWRETLDEMRRYVGRELKCCTRLEWMPGGSGVVRFSTAPTLLGLNHFFGWRRGEREPSARIQRDLTIIRRQAA